MTLLDENFCEKILKLLHHYFYNGSALIKKSYLVYCITIN